MKVNEAPVVVKVKFLVSKSVLWKAITNPEEMVQWFFPQMKDFKAEVGFKTQFNVAVEDRNYMHLWKIIEVIPEQKIVYDWRYENYKGIGHICFEISETATGSELTLTNTVLKDFQENIPEFNRESCEGGWNYFLGQQLANYLKNTYSKPVSTQQLINKLLK